MLRRNNVVLQTLCKNVSSVHSKPDISSSLMGRTKNVINFCLMYNLRGGLFKIRLGILELFFSIVYKLIYMDHNVSFLR